MKNIIYISMTLIIASCGKQHIHIRPSEVKIDPIHTRPLEITQKETVKFVRQEQMVSRYDCNGLLTSRKLETQNSLSKKITINYENRKNYWGYTVYNRRTNDGKKGFNVSDGKFVIDYAPTVFNMRVKEGLNDVEYVLNRCTEIAKNEQGYYCKGKVELQKEGIVQIDVYYSSEVLPGEKFIHPTPEECKKPPQ